MKNNFYKFLLIYLILINTSFAEQFIFKTSEIEILDNGNLINAKNGEAISKDGNLVIDARRFEYTKTTDILNAFNGTAYFKTENLNIEFEEINVNQKDLIIIAKGDLKITDNDKGTTIETESVFLIKKIIF